MTLQGALLAICEASRCSGHCLAIGAGRSETGAAPPGSKALFLVRVEQARVVRAAREDCLIVGFGPRFKFFKPLSLVRVDGDVAESRDAIMPVHVCAFLI